MNTDKYFVKRLPIQASLPEVWDAIINPIQIKKYQFQANTLSTWKVDSPILWHGIYNGYEFREKGIVLAFKEQRQLKYSFLELDRGLVDVPENYLHITHDLFEKEDHVELVVTVENFNDDLDRIIKQAELWDNKIIPAFKKLFQTKKIA
ncbi:MAG: SRPBCC domain-containing protein [Paludibacteraceae bacterium]|nr:SRPBCC domain-containing protein [Paludibacteraceae bacterium]